MPIKHRIRHSANSTESDGGLIQGKKPHRDHNAHRVIRKWPYYRAMILWLTCLAILFLALATASYGFVTREMKFIYLGVTLAAVWLFFKIMYLLACKATSCPLCRASHLVNGKSTKHKKAFKIFPFTYSTTAIFTASLMMCIRCMHCGVTFDLHKKHH